MNNKHGFTTFEKKPSQHSKNKSEKRDQFSFYSI